MSALFGRKDYKAVFKKLVSKEKFDAVLSYAVKMGDALYDKGDISKALKVYLDLLEVCRDKKAIDNSFYETTYEKITPLFFELGKFEKGIHYALLLTDEKIKHDEGKEAMEIITTLKNKFPENMDIAKKAIKVYTHIGELEKAFDIVDSFIKTKGSRPELIEIAGELLFNLKRYDDAESYFRVLKRMDSSNETARKRLADIEKLKEIKEDKHEAEPHVINESKEEVPTAHQEENKVETKHVKTSQPEKIKAPKREEYNFVNDPEYMAALKCASNDNEEEARKLLLHVAERYEKINRIEAEYIYNKILFMEPDNTEVIKKVSRLNENNKEEVIFYLKTALKYVKGEERLNLLQELTNLMPDDIKLKMALYNNFIKLGKKEEAVSMFFEIEELDPNASSIALSLLPLIKEDVQYLIKVSTLLKDKDISDTVAFQYFYATGKILFNMEEKHKGIKWLMLAHNINKLPLDDYIEIGNYISHIPGAPEKDTIAKSLYGYIDSIKDISKAKQVLYLLMKLSPNNEQYIVKEFTLLEQEGNIKELAELLVKFVERNPVHYTDTVYELTEKVMDQLNTKDLLKIAHFLKEANDLQASIKVYKAALEREPDNKEALLNTFVAHLESGQADNIVTFFDKFTPSHIFAPSLENKIKECRKKRSENPSNYNIHYILGFLYFAIERYEEAIASFQFVVRSKHYIPLMSLFIGMSFDKIGLSDFAAKHYEIGLSSKNVSDEIKVHLMYQLALFKKSKGEIAESRDLLEQVVQIDPQFKRAKKILISTLGEGKVIPIKGKKSNAFNKK